jgi:DNA-binding MarR family transcriptional regulator
MLKKRVAKAVKPGAMVAGQAREMDLALTAIRQHLRRPLTSAFAEGNLTGAQQAVMRVLVEAKTPISLSALRSQLGLAQSTVSGIVERLVKRGMIARETDPGDGRGVLLAPAKVVRDFLETKAPELTLSPLTDALRLAENGERETILAALHRLQELLEQASPARNG